MTCTKDCLANSTPTSSLFFWFYDYFSCENAKLSIFGIFSSIVVTGFQCHSSDWTLGTILWQELHHVYSFSPDFSTFSHYICINCYIKKCAQTVMTMVYVMLLHTYQFFSWCSGYICINSHIRKCAQTMWSVPQHCQQLSTACLFFSSDYSWLFQYI